MYGFFSVLDIVIIEITFIRIESNILITPAFNLTIHKSPQLKTENEIVFCGLNGIDQYLELPDQSNTCLGNPLLCDYGMSVKFNMKIKSVKENMYIFTTGGDRPDGYGVAMYYKRSQLYLTISTTTMEWTVKTNININVIINIEFSWSIQTGLALFFDGKMVAETKTYISREVTTSVYNVAFIGVSIDIQIYADIDIDGWVVTEATRETLDSVSADSTTEEATTTELPTTTDLMTNATGKLHVPLDFACLNVVS